MIIQIFQLVWKNVFFLVVLTIEITLVWLLRAKLRWPIVYIFGPNDNAVASENDFTPCNKIDKTQVTVCNDIHYRVP